MNNKTKVVTIVGVSFFLLNAVQTAIASIQLVKASVPIELTESDMDSISAGGASSANASAVAQGNFPMALTTTNTGANSYANYGVSSSVATFCCGAGSASTSATTTASGNTTSTYSGHQEGQNYSVSWSASQGY